MADEPSSAAAGWITFAGVILIIAGMVQAFAGIVAIANDDFYVVTRDYITQFSTTTWGWIHLLIGVVLFASGFGVFSGNILARTVGVVVAAVSFVAAFAWLPWYPIWAVVVMFIDLSVLWALTVHGRDHAELTA